MKKNLFTTLIFFMSGVLAFSSCSKDDDNKSTSNGMATVSMRLTDGPADYDAIKLDIQSVEVTMAGSSAVALAPVHPGIYNLLDFRNGLDTLLVRADVPPGTVQQIRLILGNNNSIIVDGTEYPLNTPSAQESGLKLNLNQSFIAGGAYTIWIDFDAGKSIVKTGNGSYKLKPVVRAYSALTNGQIEGYVLPSTALATVYAISGVDTFAAIPASDGYFRFSGLPSGIYSVWFDATVLPFNDVILQNVQVTYGNKVDLDVTTLVP